MRMKRLLSVLCLLALAVGLTPSVGAAGETTLAAKGWLETICAELTGVSDADVTAVKYTGEDGVEHALAGEDFTYLVRDMTGGVRVDIPGVKAGTYTLTVTAKGQAHTVENIQVKDYDRSGFAHYDHTEGVGAYNDDGTLKENATVIYVTEENKETVTLAQGFTVTGIGNILNCKGFDQNQKAAGNKNDVKLLLKMADANRPFVIRIVGEVTKPTGTTDAWATTNGGSKDDGGGMCMMEYGGNITIEGIGPDAIVNGWGFNFSADGTGRTALNNKRANAGQNFEVRNITFKNVPEDCVGISGAQDSKDGFKDSAEHIWVHNNSFYGPKGLPDQSKDKDKSEGDGAVDFRNGEYMTLSYNYFEGYHKTSLVGSGDDNQQYHVTWHHNHWKNVKSRSPLARQADMHIYNNLYEGQTSYCMSLRANSYIFSEYNTFLGCKDPVKNETQYSGGGVCKSWQDVFTGCTGTNDATVVTDKTETVTSANLYANFDTAAGSYVAQGDYQLDTLAGARMNIATWGGVMKPLAQIPHWGALGEGEAALSWTCTDDGALKLAGDLPAGDRVLAGWWKSNGRFGGVKVLDAASMEAQLGTGWSQVKLCWLNDKLAPKCAAAEF